MARRSARTSRRSTSTRCCSRSPTSPSSRRAELRTPKQPAPAIVSVPPFRITGTIHLMAGEATIREALSELDARFIPVTDATFWSDHLGEGRQPALLIAVNHKRCQILAQHREVDPWAGLGAPDAAGEQEPPRAADGDPAGYWLTGRSIRAPHSAQPPSYTATSSWPRSVSTQASFDGREPRLVVADQAPGAGDVGLEQQASKRRGIAQPLRAGLVGGADGHVDGARDVAEAAGVALVAVVLGGAARVDQDGIRRAHHPAHVAGGQAAPRPAARGVNRAGDGVSSPLRTPPPIATQAGSRRRGCGRSRSRRRTGSTRRAPRGTRACRRTGRRSSRRRCRPPPSSRPCGPARRGRARRSPRRTPRPTSASRAGWRPARDRPRTARVRCRPVASAGPGPARRGGRCFPPATRGWRSGRVGRTPPRGPPARPGVSWQG